MNFSERLYEKLNHRWGNAKLVRVWFISYSLILILPVLVYIITFLHTDRINYNNLMTHNSEMALAQVDTINVKLSRVVNVAAQISNYSSFKEVAAYPPHFSEENKFSLLSLFNDISGYKQSDVEIEDIFFYFPNSGKIVYFGGDCTPEFYYFSQGVGPDSEYAAWFSTISDTKKSGFFTAPGTGKGTMVYYKYFPLQFYNPGEKPAIFIRIDPQKLISNTSNTQIFITNKDFAPIFVPKGSDETLMKTVDFSVLDQNEEVKYKKQQFIAFSTDLSDWELKYFSFVDEESYFRQLHKTRITLLLSLLLMTVLGELLLLFMIKVNALPINAILLKLNDHYTRSEKDTNELQFINSAISDTLTKNEVYEDKIDMQKEYFTDNFLYKVATGYIQASPNKLFDSAGIKFDYDYFLIMALSIGNLEEMYFEKNTDVHKSVHDAQFITKNIFAELFSKEYIIYSFTNQDMPIFILNLGDNSTASLLRIKSITIEIGNLVSRHFNIDLTAGISNIHETLGGIPEAYQEALEALDQSFIMPDNVICYNPAGAPAPGEYYFPPEQEEILMTGLLHGDFALCKKHINTILDVNFEQHHISLAYAKLLITDITATFVKTVNHVTKSSSELKDFTEKTVLAINDCQSISETKEKLFDLLEVFCDYTQKNIVNPKASLSDKVVQFVEDYYYDEDLNVSMISDHFNVTSSYLSSTFKKNRGVGLLEHITTVRLRKAKDLIANTDATFESIAATVGISNVRTFFRIFSKYVGMSPGKYRELNARETIKR